MRILLLIILLGLPLIGHGYRVSPDIVYDVVQGYPLKMDVYSPSKANIIPRPGIIYIHGGCFNAGSKRDIAEEIKQMADEGFVVFSLDYRLATKAKYPAAVSDVQQAVRFIRKSFLRFGVNPRKLIVHGESAGGSLAAYLGVRSIRNRAGKVDLLSYPVQMVSDWYGRVDFTAQQSTGTDCAEVFLGMKRTAQTLPHFQRASVTSSIVKSPAKFLIIHGTSDHQVYPIHSTVLANKLWRDGKRAELFFYEGQGHGFSRNKPWEITKQAIKNFVTSGDMTSAPMRNYVQLPFRVIEHGPLSGTFDIDLILNTGEKIAVFSNGTTHDFNARSRELSGHVGLITSGDNAKLKLKTSRVHERSLLDFFN